MRMLRKEQIHDVISALFMSEGVSESAAESLAKRGAKHYSQSPKATLASSLAFARTYMKPVKAKKGAGAVKPPLAHKEGK